MRRELIPTGISGDLAQDPYVTEQDSDTVVRRQEAFLEDLAKRAQEGDPQAEAKLAQIYSTMVGEGYN